ncbi:hypothetical protein T12_2498 [Trichinella patagoniensis]|uniref:Uncharacterized protein n=1 Tax=Trichinella patagoniensis TaxID=990121 RepID=A0A0V0Z3L8_9BILA|nr:hypothetical protein T12_12474 [Trichinella patagoniensis]KRY06984.1 hypothetical protein T12_2498 [Trichinella patagoniensis]
MLVCHWSKEVAWFFTHKYILHQHGNVLMEGYFAIAEQWLQSKNDEKENVKTGRNDRKSAT